MSMRESRRSSINLVESLASFTQEANKELNLSKLDNYINWRRTPPPIDGKYRTRRSYYDIDPGLSGEWLAAAAAAGIVGNAAYDLLKYAIANSLKRWKRRPLTYAQALAAGFVALQLEFERMGI